jgi:2-polyprenyl-6-methoxyphenol hydroxylase-like FAD-dependent oxidoreductase
MYSQSRGLVEQAVRDLVRETPNVELRSGVSVKRLLFDNGRVKGVALDDGEREAERSAQLVVDASGRSSRTPRWLAENGFVPQDETTIGVDFAYASVKLRLRRGPEGGERQLNGFGPPPNHPDGAILGQIEGGLWHLSLAGRFGNCPPADRAGFLAFTERLYTRAFYDLVRDAEFAAEISSYRYPTSLWRRYERLGRFPEGLLAIGDAISSFNPVYGQGMSSAAIQAGELRSVLAERARRQLGLDGVASEFFARAANAVATPWTLAALQDLAYEKTTGERSAELGELGRYFGGLLSLAAEDPDVEQAVGEMFQLARPLSALMAEPLRSRVLARL